MPSNSYCDSSTTQKVALCFIKFYKTIGFVLFLLFSISTLNAQTIILDDTNNNPAGGAAKVATVTIPADGYYRITVKGARGGNRIYFQTFPIIDSLGTIIGFITLPVTGEGGKGGVFTTEFYLNQGTVLEYCLGAMGGLNAQGGGGGGGGTGIRIQSILVA